MSTSFPKRRPDMGEGCEERFSFEFGILIRLQQLAKEKTAIVLKSPKVIKHFLENNSYPQKNNP
ncbi:hypothetical protein [Paenibacillus sp. GCM10012306]|uniref:hypothetical protein n=1 Tax=Paenibacillus sp. GCM10012306 TaxID=3317342 RepID=UPI0036194087